MPTFPTLRTVTLDPVRAEIQIDWHGLEPGDELRGKLAGPACRFASTIEIAYPVVATKNGYRVLIPEPSAWEPSSPFLYSGKIERHRAGQKLEEARVVHGLLHLARTPAGLRLNGKPFEVREVAPPATDEATLLSLREQGFNTLLISSEEAVLWDRAARLGFFLQPRDVDGLSPERRGHFVTLNAN